MINNKNVPVLSVLLITIIITTMFVVLRGQTSKETTDQGANCNFQPSQDSKKTEDVWKELEKEFPSTKYHNQELVEGEQRIKSKKYNNARYAIDPNYHGVYGNSAIVSFLHWADALPALPIEQSRAIIIGTVTKAQAHLSLDKTSVYSEFEIEIEKVLRNDDEHPFEVGKTAKVEREGGIVIFPTGFKIVSYTSGQKMPRVGGKYLFFLTHDFPLKGPQKDIYLLTAYELSGDQVYPLDNPSETHPIVSTYKGKKATVLLDDLQQSIKNNSKIKTLPK